MTRLQRGYLPVLGLALRRPLLTVAAAVLVFVGTMASATLLKTDFIGSFTDKTTSYKWGSAVAYGCNYGNGQTVTGSWLAAQFASIAQECGSSTAGWIAYPDWKASYGIDNSGVGFC